MAGNPCSPRERIAISSTGLTQTENTEAAARITLLKKIIFFIPPENYPATNPDSMNPRKYSYALVAIVINFNPAPIRDLGFSLPKLNYLTSRLLWKLAQLNLLSVRRDLNFKSKEHAQKQKTYPKISVRNGDYF